MAGTEPGMEVLFILATCYSDDESRSSNNVVLGRDAN